MKLFAKILLQRFAGGLLAGVGLILYYGEVKNELEHGKGKYFCITGISLIA